jgi:hypothetical protein
MKLEGPLTDFIDKKFETLNQNAIFANLFVKNKLNKIDNEYYLSNKARGVECVFDQDLYLNTIHLNSAYNDAKFITKKGVSLSDVFSSHRRRCIELLGQPDKSGGGESIPVLGITAYWDVYFFDNLSLRLEYSESLSEVTLVTLASLKLNDYFEY